MSEVKEGTQDLGPLGDKPKHFTDCMEQLQEAYVAGIAASAACSYQPIARDTYGMDALLVRPPFSPTIQETSLYVQLKSTTTVKPDRRKEFFSYTFKKREYWERLATIRTHPKAILVVMATPVHHSMWTTANHDLLSMFHCCYWLSLEGIQPPENVEQPTVRIPTKNIFDASALEDILAKIDRGESLS